MPFNGRFDFHCSLETELSSKSYHAQNEWGAQKFD